MKFLNRLLTLALITSISIACCGAGASSTTEGDKVKLSDPEAKYIFYFIGDGMTASQVRLAEAALTTDRFRDNYSTQTGVENRSEALFLKSLKFTGLATSNAANRYITDSAAAGTALATGSKTDVGMIGQTPDGTSLSSVAAIAKANGMKVGVITSVSIDHATPASFYAHTESRSNYSVISDQLLESGYDYFGGGSVKWDSRARVEESDKATAYAAYRSKAEQAGYKYVTTRSEFDQTKGGDNQKVIATLDMLANEQYSGDGAALPYTIDLSKQSKEDNKITLAEFTQKGIEVLDNKKGFFLMVEGGKIDWACHANDATTCAYEVVAFDEAIGVAMEFAAKHPRETLIVVTGDHDTGGLTIGFAGTGYESAFDILANSKTSYGLFTEALVTKIKAGVTFNEVLAFACQEFGFTNNVKGDNENTVSQSIELSDYEIKLLRDAFSKSVTKVNGGTLSDEDIYDKSGYGGYDPFTTTCTNLLNNKAGIDFTSYSHTAVPVMVFAGGANSDLFSGYYDNTDIPKKIMQAAGL